MTERQAPYLAGEAASAAIAELTARVEALELSHRALLRSQAETTRRQGLLEKHTFRPECERVPALVRPWIDTAPERVLAVGEPFVTWRIVCPGCEQVQTTLTAEPLGLGTCPSCGAMLEARKRVRA